MHVAICNERLLARFGVDRILLMLARELVALGHRVTLCALRYDRHAVQQITPYVYGIDTPSGLDLFGTDRAVCEQVDSILLASGTDRPDVVVSGGWPFFGLGHAARGRGVPAVFIDAGAVPTEGYGEAMTAIQCAVRRLRALALPAFTRVLPISRFVAETQTIPERGRRDGVRVILLGADHMEQPLFAAPGSADDVSARLVLRRAATAGEKLVLALGRFEATGYKNSGVVFEVFRAVREAVPATRLLLLAGADEVAVPADLADDVTCLGVPGDAALQDIMRECVVGISTSSWEGFNLPLAEMQWLGRPAVAFNLGAHPEVVVDPWFLCANPAEMARKAAQILRDGPPARLARSGRYDVFRRHFQWRDVLRRWIAELQMVRSSTAAAAPMRPSVRPLLIDVSSASADTANSGVIRVTRQLAARLVREPEVLCAFAWWDAAACTYRALDQTRCRLLADYGGPRNPRLSFDRGEAIAPHVWLDVVRNTSSAQRPILVLPEVVLDGALPERLVWARAHALSVAAILYDLIPITHAPLCSRDVVRAFPEYLEGLSGTDLLLAISQHSLDVFEQYTIRRGNHRPNAGVVWLPGQFSAEPRSDRIDPTEPQGPCRVVCLSTIEPRKNHRVLIGAFRRALNAGRGFDATLELIGNAYAGAEDLALWVRANAAEEPRLTWGGLRSDAEVARALRQATFSVYPSLTEGFGLPVMESLWLGCPVICHNGGVMAELAAGGGCLTVDMADKAAVADALMRLAVDPGLRRKLALEALARPIGDWTWYADEIRKRIGALP